MKYDGWITGECNLPEGCTVWVWEDEQGKSELAKSQHVCGRPWQCVPLPVDPPPYKKPVADVVELVRACTWDSGWKIRMSQTVPMERAKFRRVLPTDIDQDVVSEVRGEMVRRCDDSRSAGILHIARWINLLTPPDQT